METDNRLVIAWDSGWERRVTVNAHKEFYWGDDNVLNLIYSDDFIIWQIY